MKNNKVRVVTYKTSGESGRGVSKAAVTSANEVGAVNTATHSTQT